MILTIVAKNFKFFIGIFLYLNQQHKYYQIYKSVFNPRMYGLIFYDFAIPLVEGALIAGVSNVNEIMKTKTITKIIQ